MKRLSIVLEANQSTPLLQDEIDRYVNAMSNKLPKQVKLVMSILNKYKIFNNKEDILSVRDGSLKKYERLGILPDDLKDLQKMLKMLGNNIKMLPQFLTDHQRQALEHNKLSLRDVTYDLVSKKGREETAKQHMPLINKIVNQFVGQSALSRSDLLSAGMEGFVDAMNDYKTEEEMEADGKKSTQTFAQYAAYRVRFHIINTINNQGSTVYQSNWYKNRDGRLSSRSIDRSDDDNNMIDRILQLSEEPDYDLSSNEEKKWKVVFNKLEQKFSQKACNIFYRSFGVNGFEKEKGTQIAKSLNTSSANITIFLKRMIDFLKKDQESLSVLREILNLYESKLLIDLIDSKNILEGLLQDDLYIIIEGMIGWRSDKEFKNSIKRATELLNADFVIKLYNSIESGFDNIFIERNITDIVKFLENLYPTESFKKADTEIIVNKLNELHIFYKNSNISW